MEAIEKNVVLYSEPYAITITFGYLKCKTPGGQFKETISYLTKILDRSCDFKLWPEWRTTTGHIHYHGVVWIKDKIKWFKETLPKISSLGFKLLKKIDNEDKWQKYCVKEQNIAESILGISIPITKPIIFKTGPGRKSFKGMSCIEMIYQYVEGSEEGVNQTKEGSREDESLKGTEEIRNIPSPGTVDQNLGSR